MLMPKKMQKYEKKAIWPMRGSGTRQSSIAKVKRDGDNPLFFSNFASYSIKDFYNKA